MVLVVLFVLLLVGSFLGVTTGSQRLTWSELIDAMQQRHLLSTNRATPEATVLWNLRVPRTLLAILVGANLAVAGVLLQSVMRNPLASPDVIGVTAGAALAATALIVALPSIATLNALGALALPTAGFLGAIIAAIIVFSLARRTGSGVCPVRMLLAGIAVTAMIGGFQGFLMVYFSDRVQGVVLWLIGSLNTRSWHHVALVAPCTLLGLFCAVTQIRSLDLLQLGDDVAHGLGVHVHRARLLSVVGASLLTGSAVCAVGTIGFIGLIVPHAIRLTVGGRHAWLLVLCAAGGGVMVLWADIGARMLSEMPAGVLAAMIGGPYFVILLRNQRLI